MLLYRGTQQLDPGGARRSPSYTPSLGAAIIWSAKPGDVWSQTKATVLPTSTIHVDRLITDKILTLSTESFESFLQILRDLKYGKRRGITDDEALRVLNYLHNQIIGRAKGGQFLYHVHGIREEDVPFSLVMPMSAVSELRDEMDMGLEAEDFMAEADRLEADTFIFADAPAVQKVALRLGYKVLHYPDLFAGGEFAAPEVLGVKAEELKGVRFGLGFKDGETKYGKVLLHDTYRILDHSAIETVETVATENLLPLLYRRDLLK